MKKCRICGREHNEIKTEAIINTEFGDNAYNSCRSKAHLCEWYSSEFLT